MENQQVCTDAVRATSTTIRDATHIRPTAAGAVSLEIGIEVYTAVNAVAAVVSTDRGLNTALFQVLGIALADAASDADFSHAHIEMVRAVSRATAVATAIEADAITGILKHVGRHE